MRAILMISVTTAILSFISGESLVIGNVANVQLAKHDHVMYNSMPRYHRVKHYFSSLPSYKKIQGIQAIDILRSKSTINVTSGGIGSSFVNLKMKSERGGALNFDIGIFVNPDY